MMIVDFQKQTSYLEQQSKLSEVTFKYELSTQPTVLSDVTISDSCIAVVSENAAAVS